MQEETNDRTIEKRLEQVERENKTLKRVIWLIAGVMMSIGIGGFIIGDRILRIDKIESEELVIRDKAGRPRIRLDVSPDNDAALLKFFGRDSTRQLLALGVGTNAQISGLMFFDSKGVRKMVLSNERDTITTISFANPKGEVNTSIISNGFVNTIYGNTIVVTNPRTGKPRGAFGVGDDGVSTVNEPYMDFYDESGVKRMGLLMSENSLSGMAFFDKNGKNRNFVGMKPNGEGYNVIADTSGRAEWKVP